MIEVWLRKEKCFIVSVYKPPPANVNVFISKLSQMCDQLYRESDNIILIGEININMKCKVSELHDLCDLYNLKYIVKEPTCFKSQDNPSLIDVILAAKPMCLHETVVFDRGLSDFHNILCVCVHRCMCKGRYQE